MDGKERTKTDWQMEWKSDANKGWNSTPLLDSHCPRHLTASRLPSTFRVSTALRLLSIPRLSSALTTPNHP